MSLARERPQARRTPATWVWLVVGLIVLIAAGAWALWNGRTETVAVASRDITAVVPVVCPIVAPPTERADILAPYQAPVQKVYTSIGANVRRGEVLVELSLPNQQQAYQQARENVRAAETAYANAERQYGASVAAAQKQLDSARAAERSARDAASSANAANSPAASDSTAGASASTTGTVAGSANLGSASQARMSAEEAVNEAKAARDAALLPYRQQREAARAEFAEAQAGRKMGEVKSPIRGTVLALNAPPGATVGQDRKTPLATIVNLDRLEVQGEVTPAAATYVKSGMPATLTVTEVPNQQFDAEVLSLTSQVTKGLGGLSSKTHYVALVRVKNRDGLVKPGMHGSVGVKAGDVKDVLAVPNDAIRDDSHGRPTVEVQRGGKWQPTIVELGMSDGHYTEIKSGLQQGDVVQVKPKLL